MIVSKKHKAILAVSEGEDNLNIQEKKGIEVEKEEKRKDKKMMISRQQSRKVRAKEIGPIWS